MMNKDIQLVYTEKLFMSIIWNATSIFEFSDCTECTLALRFGALRLRTKLYLLIDKNLTQSTLCTVYT